MPRPDDRDYFVDDRTIHVAQGDIFREIVFTGPAESAFMGYGMLLHYTSNMMRGAPGTAGYAHESRLLAPIYPFPMLEEVGVAPDQLKAMRSADGMGRYMYLPSYPGEWDESGVILHRAERFVQDQLVDRRVTQLQYRAAQQLQRKLARVFFGTELAEDPVPDMSDHWNP